jgi:hypothetical protein
MINKLQEICIKKIYENIKFADKPGMIIASPSTNPPYQFHWIRDSGIVIRVIIDLYLKFKNPKDLLEIFNYIENEYSIQSLKTLTGLGEPKINLDGSAYNDPWGRPQNDGPPLRGINMIRLYKLLNKNYKNISYLILEIIKKDLIYTCENYNKPCFELWEEITGWHFYTRMVQIKFIKDFLHSEELIKNFDLDIKHINDIYDDLKIKISHHIKEDYIISSFNEKGNINKLDDASIFLAFCHINFDKDILKFVPVSHCINNYFNLRNFFRNKYSDPKLNMIGRYKNDKYYDGHLWILCSLSVCQVFKFICENNINQDLENISNKIIKYVKSININYDLSEQYDHNNKVMLSAKKLTWNYAELYFSLFKKN